MYKVPEKEYVKVFPGFGVQLETHYSNGSVELVFVPMGTILKPVIVECVTPFTCYFRLSLILREEDEIIPVLKRLHPNLKILVLVWKALCAAVEDDTAHPVHIVPVTQIL